MLYMTDKTRESDPSMLGIDRSQDKQFKLSNIAAHVAILLTTAAITTLTTIGLNAYTYPELYPKSLGGNANDIDSFKSGILDILRYL